MENKVQSAGKDVNVEEIKKKVVVAIIEIDEKFVGVSRKYDHTRFGLPGGKCDLQESTLNALKREIFEETGLTITEALLLDIRYYEGYETYCYIIKSFTGNLSNRDTLLANGEALCEMKTIDELCANFCADYNTDVFHLYNLFKTYKKIQYYVLNNNIKPLIKTPGNILSCYNYFDSYDEAVENLIGQRHSELQKLSKSVEKVKEALSELDHEYNKSYRVENLVKKYNEFWLN